jgi:allantoin permease
MIANYYFVQKQQIDLNALYVDKHKKEEANPFYGLNKPAYVATILALVLSLSGQFIPQVKIIADISWFVGFATGFVLYLVLKKWTWDSKKVKETAYQEGK